MQHSLTAAAAAEDGVLLELTSPCRVTSAENDLSLSVKKYDVRMSERQMNVTSDKTLLLLSGQFETLMSTHYAHTLQRS